MLGDRGSRDDSVCFDGCAPARRQMPTVAELCLLVDYSVVP